MQSEMLLTVRCTLKRGLAALCLVMTAGSSNLMAQDDAMNYCEPSGAVKDELKKLPKWNEDEMSYKLYQKRRLVALENLAQKYPSDFHVRNRYYEARRQDDMIDHEALTNEFRVLMQKNPNDPVAAYFYAKTLVGSKTKEAIATLDKLAQQAPAFSWTYLELGTIYTYPAFRDAAKSRDNLKKWAARCPDTLDSVWMLTHSGDQELMRDALRRLRARLAAPAGPEDLNYYNDAWSLEFKLRPLPEHVQVRRQIADELKQLRAQNLGSKEWLLALQQGYKMADDKEGRGWAEDEMLRLFPKSGAAALRAVRQRWDSEHPHPKQEEAAEKKQAYNQALLKATDEWLKQWPNDVSVWSARYFAVEDLENAGIAEVEAAAEGFLKAMAKNEGNIYYIPPVEVMVASAYAKRNIATERIPALVQKGLTEMEQQEKHNRVSDLYPREDGEEGSNLKYTRWYSWPILAEAYAKLKQPEKAREVLAQMAEALNKEQPTENGKQSRKAAHLVNQVTYWRAVAKVAEAENRKLDALTSYQTALSFRPKQDDKAKGVKKDELADSAQRLWKELGGTEEGWQAYLARHQATRSAEVAEATTWDEQKLLLPEFALADLKGKKWQLADLKGKVVFITFWATWCGPCTEELPYVQKLHEQMKNRKDVLVLTMNIDDELGLVEPFTKENKYNFTVIPAVDYARGVNVYSIPRNWVVGADGMVYFEGMGFGGEGNEWMKKANEMIEKVKGGREVKGQE
jgi:thiol-disulfide isomerase/thioredoxin